MTAMNPPRQPPRFVPTLTDVVEVPPAAPSAQPVSEASAPAAPAVEEAAREVLVPEATLSAEEAFIPASVEAQDAAIPANVLDSAEATEALRTRVMARVQANLQERLHATLTEVVQELQTQTLYKLLRAEIDAMVVNAVQEAVAQELERLRTRSRHP